MKNSLAKIVSTAALISALGMPLAAESPFRFYGEGDLSINGSSPVSVQNVPSYITDPSGNYALPDEGLGGILCDGDIELRAGLEYKNPDWFTLKVGPKLDFSLNGGMISTRADNSFQLVPDPDYFYNLSKSPDYSINVGLFARTSFFHDILFAEYSASFLNEVSIRDGTQTSSVDSSNPGQTNIINNTNVENSYKLGDYIEHTISAGIHLPIKSLCHINGSFFELYGGLDFSQIITKTDLGNQMELSSDNPSFRLGVKLGIETGQEE